MQALAAILTIGDELLIGQVIDTNSAYIAQELNKIGIPVVKRIAVGDNWENIWQSLQQLQAEASIVIITGGLGPTADDITKPLLCKYFDGEMIMHPPTLAHVTYIFEHILKRPMIERNIKQAEVPSTCNVLKNEKGTAPGMHFVKDATHFFALPGVPHEMKGLMQQQVLPIVTNLFPNQIIEHRTLLTAGIGESFLAELIQNFENNLPKNISLAYLPNYGMVRLRLTAKGIKEDNIETSINAQFAQLTQLVKPYLVIAADKTMPEVVAELLTQYSQTLATAESCTGGYIAAQLTAKAGASAYFNGAVVSYSNKVKQDLLQVSPETLTNDGAVSEATVIQMATAAKNVMLTDYAIAVSGIMGPDGGSTTKPVGTVFICVTSAKETVVKMFNFRFDRARNIDLTAVNALNMLRELIIRSNN